MINLVGNVLQMKVTYYLAEARKKNLYCRITDGQERVTFSLGHSIDPKEWNAIKEEGSSDDPYFYTLWDFKKYLEKRYHELKAEGKNHLLEVLKREASEFVDKSGIEGLARKMFDWENEKDGVYKYDTFIKAFEQHTGLSKSDYRAQAVGNVVYFYKDENTYEINTYEGLKASLKDYFDRRSYDEIFTMTDEGIWSQIYLDAGIQKHKFMPVMLKEWELYWNDKSEARKGNPENVLNIADHKLESWRKLQVFMECYNEASDIIELASDIDDFIIYPLSIVTMLKIFDPDVCYSEYCEFEFDSGRNEWESISINGDDLDGPVLYIRESE